MFKRHGGITAEEAVRMAPNDPELVNDSNLKLWRVKIINKAHRTARAFINIVFPENKKNAFCRLPNWPTVLPWIGRPQISTNLTSLVATQVPGITETETEDGIVPGP